MNIAYYTNQLLNSKTQEPVFGGGERYCLELANLLTKLGHNVTIYQDSNKYFELTYKGFKLIGKKSITTDEVFERYDKVIYNLPNLIKKSRQDSITICHGMWFDKLNNSQTNWHKYLNDCFENNSRIVCVDTFSMNFLKYILNKTDNLYYIPNFVDNSLFKPTNKKNKILKVLFARRADLHRGVYLMEDILSNIINNCDIMWSSGLGEEKENTYLKNLSTDERFKFYESTFEEMPSIYSNSDISVIPTIACEGTSLTCLESMASGCAVISTNVGGLPDLIQDGYNGLLVSADAISIANAIDELICNKELREKLQLNAIESSKYFSRIIWQKKWTDILTDFLK